MRRRTYPPDIKIYYKNYKAMVVKTVQYYKDTDNRIESSGTEPTCMSVNVQQK